MRDPHGGRGVLTHVLSTNGFCSTTGGRSSAHNRVQISRTPPDLPHQLLLPLSATIHPVTPDQLGGAVTPGGGVNDYMIGGGDADIFVFIPGSGNGRDSAFIGDYEVGIDQVDIGDSGVLFSYSLGASTYLFLDGGDFDTLTVIGASSIDEISFV